LRRLYAGACGGTEMEGRFLGSVNCGPDGGGEVAPPGGLLAIVSWRREGEVRWGSDRWWWCASNYCTILLVPTCS
jgi:hypothetical protein